MNEAAPARIRQLWTACCLIVGAAGVHATVPDSRIINFKDAIQIALAQNTAIALATNAAARDDVSVSEARSQFLPDLRLSTSAVRYYGRFFSQIDGRIIDQATDLINLGAVSGMTLFEGWHDVAALHGAKLMRAAGQFELQRTRETVIFAVISNFLALLQDREQLRVVRENLAAETRLQDEIQVYVEGGSRTTADLYTQQAAVASAHLTVVNAERAVELGTVDLMQTLHLDPQGACEFVAPDERSMAAAGEPVNLETLRSRALSRRNDIAAEQARVKAAEENVRVAHSAFWPSVSLTGAYGTGYSSPSSLASSQQLSLNRAGSVAIDISIPLYDRGAARSASLRAELQLQQARIVLDNLQEEVGLQVRRAHLEFQSALAQLSAAEARRRAADKALEAAQFRYETGASTLVELAQARADSVQAQSALVGARYNLLLQRTFIDYESGDLTPESSLQ